jgi:hypothetical protein
MNSEVEIQGESPTAVSAPMPAAPEGSGNRNAVAAAPLSVSAFSQQSAADMDKYLESILAVPPVEPWPHAVDGAELLEEIRRKITSHVVLPRWAAETMALWVPHTFAFQYRDITTYLGIESPEHRCGKSTLITILSDPPAQPADQRDAGEGLLPGRHDRDCSALCPEVRGARPAG